MNWLVHYSEFDLKESIGKGAMGDYQRATWKSKDVCYLFISHFLYMYYFANFLFLIPYQVAIKTLVNQKLKEGDLLRLLSDSATMNKISHANLLQFYAVCLDQNRIYFNTYFLTFYLLLLYLIK